ncbi:MAG: diacylglycerol kinase family protein [Gordonibacter sp.]|nr:diacylglycerol kinase family protein [Gordonibacter sp.]
MVDDEDGVRPRTLDPDTSRPPCCGDSGFVRNEADKKHGSRFSLACAFSCAAAGVVHAVRTQRNMKIHLVVAVLAIVLGFLLGIDAPSWMAVVLVIAAVFATECLNTAIEALVDLVSPDYHELARYAKDCAAGAVLICALSAVVVAFIVFVPRLLLLIVG